METKDLPVDNKIDDSLKEEITEDAILHEKEPEKKQEDEIEVKIEILEATEAEKENLKDETPKNEKEEDKSEEVKKEESKKEAQNIHNVNEDSKETSDKEDIQKYKGIFILSYLGILFFLPLIVCPNSNRGRFHANQGLVLLLASILGEIGQIILQMLMPISFFGFLSFIFSIYSLAMFVLMIIGMINASKGEQKPLPIIGDIQIIK